MSISKKVTTATSHSIVGSSKRSILPPLAPPTKESSLPQTIPVPVNSAAHNGAHRPVFERDLSRQLQILEILLREIRERKISVTLLHALLILHSKRHQKISLSDLATDLCVTTANITAVADGLEKGGFAKRCYNDGDRRRILLELAPYGCMVVQWIDVAMAGLLEPDSDTVDSPEIQNLIPIQKQAASLVASPGDRKKGPPRRSAGS